MRTAHARGGASDGLKGPQKGGARPHAPLDDIINMINIIMYVSCVRLEVARTVLIVHLVDTPRTAFYSMIS